MMTTIVYYATTLLMIMPVARGTMAAAAAADSRATPGTLPESKVATAMNSVIDSSFATVPADDGYRFQTYHVSQPTVQPSWQICSKIDYTAQQCLATQGTFLCNTSTPEVQKELAVLGIGACFSSNETMVARDGSRVAGVGPGSTGCKAILAFLDAHARLTKDYPMGPAFANADVVAWTNDTVPRALASKFGPYPSWRSGGVSVRPGNASAGQPPKGTWVNLGSPWGSGNAANGYALCDIVVTILQQTNNQAGTGTCGPSAILASLNYNDPVASLKFALELLWTGRNRALPSPTCPYVVENQPGLIDIPTPCASLDSCPAYKKCLDSGGNEGDCKMLSVGQPLNPVGIQSMSTQAWQSSYFRSIDADSCAKKPLGMNFEGADLTSVKLAQQSSPALEMYLCKHLLNGGKNCEFGFNAAKVPQLSAGRANYWAQLPGLTGTDLGVMQGCVKNPAQMLDCLSKAATTNVRVGAFFRGVLGDSNQSTAVIEGVLGSIYPSLTPAALDDACKTAGQAVFFVNGDFIQSNTDNPRPYVAPLQPPLAPNDNRQRTAAQAYPMAASGTCNHWILLESCNSDDTYTFWTWGYKVRFSKKFMLGNTSTAVPTGGMFCSTVHPPHTPPSPENPTVSGGAALAPPLSGWLSASLAVATGLFVRQA